MVQTKTRGQETTLREVTAEASCSSANLGSGFDVFGLALNKYADRVRVRLNSRRDISITVKGQNVRKLPRDVKKNSAGPPATALLRMSRLKMGLDISVEKNVPQGLGLGSSGATAAASTKAVSHLLSLDLPGNELVRIASLGEKAVSGSAHADNVAASLLGGFVIVYDNSSKVLSLKPPRNLAVVIVTPKIPLGEEKTRLARKLVPRNVQLANVILNIGRASAVAAGFARGDIETIGSGMEDEIAEPHREKLIPGYHQVKRAGLEAGASGVSISGAGPSLIALVDRTRKSPRSISNNMTQAFAKINIRSTAFVTKPAPGARIIGRK